MKNEMFLKWPGLNGLAVITIMAALIFSCAGNKEKRIVAVAPTKMNVFYLGVDNPVSIAVSGVNNADISATMDNGTIEKKGDFYLVNPQKTGLTTVSVFVKGKLAGTPQFRVKSLPDPTAMVASMSGGSVEKSKLLNAHQVTAEIVNTDFEVPFRIKSFTVSVSRNGTVKEETANDQNFTKAQEDLIKSVEKGKRVYFQDIKAVGPDGQERKLATIDFLIQ